MDKKIFAAVLPIAVLAAGTVFAQGAQGGRDAFLKNQAWEEMQKVSGMIDVLESNQAQLAERVSRIERGGGEIAAVKADIEALKAEISKLRADMQAQRKEIVADLLKRIQSAQPQTRPAPAVSARPEATAGEEYTVRPGDTLSLISQAFGTSVAKLKEMNGLKSDMLRVGQKLVVPAQSPRRR